MGFPAYLVDNLFDDPDLVGITVSTEDSVFDRVRLSDKFMGSPFRWTSGAGGTIELEFSVAKSPTGIFAFNHNALAGSTIELFGADAASGSDETHTLTFRALDVYKQFVPTSARKFWRFSITGDTQPVGTVTEVGELSLGILQVLTGRFEFGWTRVYEKPRFVMRTVRGVDHRVIRNDFDRFRHLFNDITTAMKDEIVALVEASRGSSDPIAWVPNLTDPDSFYVHFDDNPITVQSLRFPTWQVELNLKSQSRGREILR